MAIRIYKPTSAGRRGMSVSDFSGLTRKEPEKSLIEPKKKTAGRNHHGRITSRRRGGGHKRQYRRIDFKRNKDGIPATIAALEYDPNRSARIALLHYTDGEKRYILATHDMVVGQTVMSGVGAEPTSGNCMELSRIPLGLTVHCIELTPGKGGQLARSAGCSAQLAAREGEYAVLVMPSGETRKVHVRCRATIGQVGNIEHNLVSLGKAGRNRWLGRRPKVRGTAQNPVAHPMGGGEGRSAGGRHPCSPWGKPAKGGKTRKRGRASTKFIIRGRKRKKRK